ncbi:YihY/virulence factor BrkB family protein [Candidatus Omnitrophota bacterium]
MSKISKLVDFIKRDIWRIHSRKLPRKQSFLITQLRVVLLSLRGFAEDKCSLRASALTFYSLLSIVPVLAMAFGVAKGFGFEKMLENQLIDKMPGQQEVLAQIITFANALLDNTRGGLVAGIGVALLFWTVIKVLTNIERSFNDIWGIKKVRSLGRRFSDYLSIMLICPILLIVSSGVTVFVTSQARMITERIAFLGPVGSLISFVLDLLPYCVIWVVFSFIYIFMPNTKVNFKAGLVAGVVAGTIYQVVQWAYIAFQVGVAKYNAIYGSFAALPLFLLWLQLSWLIVLFGAEVSFAHQNVDTYEFEPDCLLVSSSFKKILSLNIVHLLAKKFSRGEKQLSDNEIAHTLEIPIRLVRQLIFELTEGGIISAVKDNSGRGTLFQPARDINTLTIKYVLDCLDNRGSDSIPVAHSKELSDISDSLKAFSEQLEKSPANRLLKDI